MDLMTSKEKKLEIKSEIDSCKLRRVLTVVHLPSTQKDFHITTNTSCLSKEVLSIQVVQ
jgi:hypothetical protein